MCFFLVELWPASRHINKVKIVLLIIGVLILALGNLSMHFLPRLVMCTETIGVFPSVHVILGDCWGVPSFSRSLFLFGYGVYVGASAIINTQKNIYIGLIDCCSGNMVVWKFTHPFLTHCSNVHGNFQYIPSTRAIFVGLGVAMFPSNHNLPCVIMILVVLFSVSTHGDVVVMLDLLSIGVAIWSPISP